MAFIGLKVPHEVARLLWQLDVPGDKEPMDHAHITLLCLEDTSIEQLAKAVVAVFGVTSKTQPFTVQTNRTSSFLSKDGPVPIICPIDSPALHDLQGKVRAALDEAGVEYSKRFPDYKPHVTLAYCKDREVAMDGLFDKHFPVVEWGVGEVVLWGGHEGDDRLVVSFPFVLSPGAQKEAALWRAMVRVAQHAPAAEGSLTQRVAARYHALRVASLSDDLSRKMDTLLRQSPVDTQDAKALGQWLEENFRFKVRTTPKGGKQLKEDLNSLHWWLIAGYMNGPDAQTRMLESTWAKLKPQIDEVTRFFTDEGGKVVPRELKLGGNTYKNLVGFEEGALKKYAERLDTIFKDIKGWRTKAFRGGLEIVLAGPDKFNGTAGGKYRSSEDALYIRATPNVLKRSGGSYGSFEYIIVHEMGHRFEHKVRLPEDFDRMQWHTSKYSHNDGESFAELFAIGHFDIKGPWDPLVVERFEKLMTTGNLSEVPAAPAHLQLETMRERFKSLG